MADVAKGYAIGDTVWVHYINTSLQFVPQSRVVHRVNVNSSTNNAVVEFTNGDSVTDGAVVTVYTTQALAANGIVDWGIVQLAASVVLDVETSVASTASQASTTLGRVS